MRNQSSVTYRNYRNQCNPKCDVCGLNFKKGVCLADHKKGQYTVWIEKEGRGNYIVYSTDSVFWRDFFR